MTVDDSTRRVPLTGRGGIVRGWAIVDAEDFDEVAQFRWCLNNGYAARRTGGRANGYTEYMHRRLLGLERGDRRQCDHANHDPLDNRRSNIRIVSNAENHQNIRGGYGRSGRRGVYFDARVGRWMARHKKDGKLLFIGLFDCPDAAALAAADWRAVNFPFSREALEREGR